MLQNICHPQSQWHESHRCRNLQDTDSPSSHRPSPSLLSDPAEHGVDHNRSNAKIQHQSSSTDLYSAVHHPVSGSEHDNLSVSQYFRLKSKEEMLNVEDCVKFIYGISSRKSIIKLNPSSPGGKRNRVETQDIQHSSLSTLSSSSKKFKPCSVHTTKVDSALPLLSKNTKPKQTSAEKKVTEAQPQVQKQDRVSSPLTTSPIIDSSFISKIPNDDNKSCLRKPRREQKRFTPEQKMAQDLYGLNLRFPRQNMSDVLATTTTTITTTTAMTSPNPTSPTNHEQKLSRATSVKQLQQHNNPLTNSPDINHNQSNAKVPGFVVSSKNRGNVVCLNCGRDFWAPNSRRHASRCFQKPRTYFPQDEKQTSPFSSP